MSRVITSQLGFVSAKMVNSADQTVGTLRQSLVFDTVLWDTGGFTGANVNAFTIPATGHYLVSMSVDFNQTVSGHVPGIGITIQGAGNTTIVESDVGANIVDNYGMSCMAICRLTVGSIIVATTFNATGGNQTVFHDAPYQGSDTQSPAFAIQALG